MKNRGSDSIYNREPIITSYNIMTYKNIGHMLESHYKKIWVP